jgi:hypothetical protein
MKHTPLMIAILMLSFAPWAHSPVISGEIPLGRAARHLIASNSQMRLAKGSEGNKWIWSCGKVQTRALLNGESELRMTALGSDQRFLDNASCLK